jgi:hypothetical protein
VSEQATFHVGAPAGERWTARAGSAFVGRDVRYAKLGKVGQVVRAVPVASGRALRLHVALTRHLPNPDRRKFALAPQRRP